MKLNHLDRITVDQGICHGKLCIRGMRWPAVVLLGELGAGMTYEEVLEDLPELEREDICAAINYALLDLSERKEIKMNS